MHSSKASTKESRAAADTTVAGQKGAARFKPPVQRKEDEETFESISSASIPDSPVQRIIYFDIDEVDFGLIIDVYQMLKNGVDKRVAVTAMMKDLKYNKEPLRIIGHGDSRGNKFSGMSPQQLGAIVQQTDFTQADYIELLACNLALGGAGSFAAQFFQAAGGMQTVVAFEGSNVSDEKGVNLNISDGAAAQAGYDAILEKHKLLIAQLGVAFSPGNIKAALNIGPNETPDSLAAKVFHLGRAIWQKCQPLYDELYAHNARNSVPGGIRRFEAQ